MAKHKMSFECASCAYTAAKWMGCCPECKEWNSFHEKKAPTPGLQPAHRTRPSILHDITTVADQKLERFVSNIYEWDRVTGGGIVPGSFLILTGDPGIGKSTLLLQISAALAQEQSIIYFSSEESLSQVKGRFKRLQLTNHRMQFSEQSTLEDVIATTQHHQPDIIIIDSIQNVYSSEHFNLPGSIAQLKEAAFHLMRLAKEHNIAIIVTGHITKEGNIAGPKMLEHMVDTVLYLQKDDQWNTRILRAVKNRFGSINELGFFSMKQTGLHEMQNMNEHLIKDSKHAPGSCLISSLEGTRPLFLELQALTVKTQFSVAQRVVTGIEQKQVIIIAAILEKYLHVKLSAHDIFFKLSGSFKIKDHGADLGIALALLSSYFQIPLPEKTIALGEISLTGHIKPIQHIDIHIKEAESFGFKHLLLSSDQRIKTKAQAQYFKTVYDLLTLFPE